MDRFSLTDAQWKKMQPFGESANLEIPGGA